MNKEERLHSSDLPENNNDENDIWLPIEDKVTSLICLR